jgi:hypothetical protein
MRKAWSFCCPCNSSNKAQLFISTVIKLNGNLDQLEVTKLNGGKNFMGNSHPLPILLKNILRLIDYRLRAINSNQLTILPQIKIGEAKPFWKF